MCCEAQAKERRRIHRKMHSLAAVKDTDFPRSALTRNLCITGLCASASTSIICIIIGVLYFNEAQTELRGWLPTEMTRTLKEILPLLINILVTLLTESTGLIHQTTLRWALGSKLTFSSNLRLFSRGGRYWAFGRISNFLNAGFLILSYSAPPFIVVGIPSKALCSDDTSALWQIQCIGETFVNFCPGALIALGIGLGGTAALSTWQLFSITVPTWSSSPIDMVWASVLTGQRRRFENRCLISVHDSSDPITTIPRKPEPQQRPALYAHRQIRNILIYLWILVLVVFIWFACLLGSITYLSHNCPSDRGCSVYLGSSWSLLPDTDTITSLAQIDTLGSDFNVRVGVRPNPGLALTFLLTMAFQSILTMGLHCTELLVNISRDEDIWRETTTQCGYIPRNALVTVIRSWKNIILLMLKPIIHWLLGLGMTFYYGAGIFMRPPQLLYLSIALVVLAGLGTFVCLTKPKGPQPAAFGHVQTLANLIDEWSEPSEPLFWGSKGRGVRGICHAGTSSSPLKEVDMAEVYAAG